MAGIDDIVIEDINYSEADFAQLQADKASLERKLKKANERIAKLEANQVTGVDSEELEDLKSQVASLMQEKAEVEAKLQTFEEAKKAEIEKIISDFEKEIENYKRELEKIGPSTEDYETNKKLLEKTQEELERIKQVKKIQDKKFAGVSGGLTNSKKANVKLKEEKKTLVQDLKNVKKELDLMKEIIENSKTELAQQGEALYRAKYEAERNKNYFYQANTAKNLAKREREAEEQRKLEAERKLAEEEQRKLEAERKLAEEEQRKLEAERKFAEEEQRKLETERKLEEEAKRKIHAEKERIEKEITAINELIRDIGNLTTEVNDRLANIKVEENKKISKKDRKNYSSKVQSFETAVYFNVTKEEEQNNRDFSKIEDDYTHTDDKAKDFDGTDAKLQAIKAKFVKNKQDIEKLKLDVIALERDIKLSETNTGSVKKVSRVSLIAAAGLVIIAAGGILQGLHTKAIHDMKDVVAKIEGDGKAIVATRNNAESVYKPQDKVKVAVVAEDGNVELQKILNAYTRADEIIDFDGNEGELDKAFEGYKSAVKSFNKEKKEDYSKQIADLKEEVQGLLSTADKAYKSLEITDSQAIEEAKKAEQEAAKTSMQNKKESIVKDLDVVALNKTKTDEFAKKGFENQDTIEVANANTRANEIKSLIESAVEEYETAVDAETDTTSIVEEINGYASEAATLKTTSSEALQRIEDSYNDYVEQEVQAKITESKKSITTAITDIEDFKATADSLKEQGFGMQQIALENGETTTNYDIVLDAYNQAKEIETKIASESDYETLKEYQTQISTLKENSKKALDEIKQEQLAEIQNPVKTIKVPEKELALYSSKISSDLSLASIHYAECFYNNGHVTIISTATTLTRNQVILYQEFDVQPNALGDEITFISIINANKTNIKTYNLSEKWSKKGDTNTVWFGYIQSEETYRGYALIVDAEGKTQIIQGIKDSSSLDDLRSHIRDLVDPYLDESESENE